MNRQTLSQPQWRTYYSPGFWIAEIAITAGFILSIMSWLGVCVEHCSANKNFLLFGLPFGIFGILFFAILFAAHTFSLHYSSLTRWVGWMLASGLGAEVIFIGIQKYQIGHWCPVCLSIATSLLVAGLTFLAGYIQTFYAAIQQSHRGDIMRHIQKALASVSFFVIGILLAFIGVSKPDLAQAAANSMKERLVFGNANSAVEMYLITDWFCPSCKKIEPQLKGIYKVVEPQAKFYFVDYPIHRESLNFSPYNLAFLLNNKKQYLQARQMLHELTAKTKSPTDEDIVEAAKKEQIAFTELSYLDVKTGLEFFDKVAEQYDLSATPTLIITNTKTKKVVKLEGSNEITEKKILKAIETVNQAS